MEKDFKKNISKKSQTQEIDTHDKYKGAIVAVKKTDRAVSGLKKFFKYRGVKK